MKEECKEKGEKETGKIGTGTGESGRDSKPQAREPLRTFGAVIQWNKGDGA